MDKLSSEWEPHDDSESSKSSTNTQPSTSSGSISNKPSDVIGGLFRGRLVSQVTCKRCDFRSRTFEPFSDLSLEFPDRFHDKGEDNTKVVTSQQKQPPAAAAAGEERDVSSCHVTEMLQNFTAKEKLDGGQVYECEKCNSKCE